MGVAGDYSPAQKLSNLRTEYNGYQLTHTQYIVNDPCHALTSETMTAEYTAAYQAIQ